MEKRFDVLGLGVVAVDELLYVESYPPPDSKAQVLSRERQCGGLKGIPTREVVDRFLQTTS